MRPALGTYIPGASAVHALDPRAKLTVAAVAVAALFAAPTWPVLIAVLALSLLAGRVAGIPLRYSLRVLMPVAFIAAFTVAANALSVSEVARAAAHVAGAVLDLGPITLSLPGLVRGLYFALRLAAMMLATTLVTLTTSPVALTDGMATMMRPTARFGVPVDDIATMLSIALRFIPTIIDEVDRIVVAQTARGARFDVGSPLTRARAWVPVIVPLFVQLFRRADTLALAMEARCYGSATRTRLRALQMRPADIATVVGALAALVLAIASRGW